MKTKISSIFIALILVFFTLSAYATPLSISFENGDTFSADPTGADSLSFYLDGKYLGEADSSGNLKAPSFPAGTHSLKAVALYSDGTAAGDEMVLSTGVKAVLKEQNQDFNAYDGTGTSINFTQSKKAALPATFSVAAGKTGKTGDKALNLLLDVDDEVSSNMPYIQPLNFTNYNQGMAEIEFDVKLNTLKTRLRFTGVNNWTSGSKYDLVTTNGEWLETGANTTTDWQHIKFILNYDTSRVSFEVDGQKTLAENKPITYGSGASFRMSLFQSKITLGDPRGGFTIDNFKAINYKNYTGITTATIDDGKVKLILDTPIGSTSIAKEKISLNTRDGQQIGITQVDFDDMENALILTPSYELPKCCKLDVSIDSGITLTDSSVTQNAMSAVIDSTSDLIDVDVDFFVNSGALLSSEQIGNGDVISASVNAENVSDVDTDFYCVLTLRKDKKLISISAEPVSITALSQGCITLSLPAITDNGDYEVYLMTCNNLDSALALSRIYKITKN